MTLTPVLQSVIYFKRLCYNQGDIVHRPVGLNFHAQARWRGDSDLKEPQSRDSYNASCYYLHLHQEHQQCQLPVNISKRFLLVRVKFCSLARQMG